MCKDRGKEVGRKTTHEHVSDSSEAEHALVHTDDDQQQGNVQDRLPGSKGKSDSGGDTEVHGRIWIGTHICQAEKGDAHSHDGDGEQHGDDSSRQIFAGEEREFLFFFHDDFSFLPDISEIIFSYI